jgi:hypothetical protein
MATEAVTSKLGSAGAALLDQLAALTAHSISPETARILLELRFHGSHHERFNQLSTKAQEDSLSPSEQEELDDYIRTADVLAVIQSRARQALRNAGITQ